MFEIGNSLREARYRQQLELSDVEQATKIRARYLQALEEESFEALPAATYVKGFLRTYADYLGLDGQLYVDEYNSRYGIGEDAPREPVVARRSSAVHQRHRRLERRGVLVALGAIAIVVALFIAAFKFSGGSNNPPIPNLGTTRATPPAPPATKKKRYKAAAPVPLKFFVLAANGDCWMDVRNWSASGAPKFTGTVSKGHWQRFVVPRRLWINFGNPGNVKAAVNGRTVTIPGGGRPVMVLVTRSGVSVAQQTG